MEILMILNVVVNNELNIHFHKSLIVSHLNTDDDILLNIILYKLKYFNGILLILFDDVK